MNQLKQSIQQILSAKEEKPLLYSNLLQIIAKNEQQIAKSQTSAIQLSVLMNFFHKKLSRLPTLQFYTFLERFIESSYTRNSSLLKVIYQIIPSILTKYIQSSQQKNTQLQNIIKIIYNNELVHYNKKLISKELLLSKSSDLDHLYKEHFNSIMKMSIHGGNICEIGKNEEITSFNRVNVLQKSVILQSIFNNLEVLTQRGVIGYLWMVYVYCGGTQVQQQRGVSLYLLQKKNMFSIFKYYMSGQQMSIILLTLYELSVERRKNKFQILSGINMIHKKAANESMFKLSEVAQSIIHLLEDEYGEAFS